jgi:hypothetical protein
LLYPARELAAEAVDIVRPVNLRHHRLDARAELLGRLQPAPRRDALCQLVPDPGDGGLVEHHLLQSPRLRRCVVAHEGAQSVPAQGVLEGVGDAAGVGVVEAGTAVHEEHGRGVATREADIEGRADEGH